jgi:hypothetical protein
MQSVRLKKFLTFQFLLFVAALSRRHFNFASASLMAVGMLCWVVPSQAQDATAAPATTQKYDVGLSGFYQVTGAANGNFIRDDTTESGGGLVSFRRPWRPWAGYEANVGYTKFYEAYNKGVVKVQNNVTDLNVSYLFQAHTVFGVQPYASVGGGIILFSPIGGTLTDLNSPTTKSLPSQLLPEFVFNLGINYPITSRFGVRGGMRGQKYKTPDFHQISIDTKTLRTTLEPNLGVYYRF